MAKIVFFNQGGGQLLQELVVSSAAALGPVSYYGPHSATMAPDVRLVNAPRHRNSGTISRLMAWFAYLLVAGFKGLTEPGNPLLFIVSNPPLSPVLGVIAKKLKGQRYVLLYYDMYPEALEKFAGLSRQSALARVWRNLNRVAINNADLVVTISPQLAKTLSQYYPEGHTNERVRVVPTWVDAEHIRPLAKDKNWFARQHGQVGKLTVLYSGNLGTVHDLTMLPEIACRLRDFLEIHFLIIGEGAGRGPLESECARLGLQNVTFLPMQSESTLPFSLACGDIGIVALASGAEGISMPSKTYYMMAAGTALLGLSRQESDLATVIRECQCGVNIMPGDVDGAVQAIVEVYRRPALLQQYRERARLAAEERFSRAVCVPRMLEIVRPLL